MCRIWFIVLAFSKCVVAKEYIEQEKPDFTFPMISGMNEIPKSFEISGHSNVKDFHQYLNDINALAERENLTVKYKVKVEVTNTKDHVVRKILKTKPKKYLIPLKKKSMMMSSFEAKQRKIAEEKQKMINSPDEIEVTTPMAVLILTTKIPSSGKYKPEVRKRKSKLAKIVKPVKNRIITLKL